MSDIKKLREEIQKLTEAADLLEKREAEAEAARQREKAEISDKTKSLLDRAAEIYAEINAIKELYAEYDEIIDELIDQGVESISHNNKQFTIVDNFQDKNKSWKSTPFKRFDLSIEETKRNRDPFPIRRSNRK